MPQALETLYQNEQLAIQRSISAQVAVLWSYLEVSPQNDNTQLWLAAVIERILQSKADSEYSAHRFYTRMRGSEFSASPLPATDLAELRRSLLTTGPYRIQGLVKEGMSVKQAKAQILTLHKSVAADRAVEGGREVLGQSIHEDKLALGYARLPKPNACAFCVMLASRGAVYSKDTVLRTTSRAKHRGPGVQYHEKCGCSMVPLFDTDQKLPDLVVSAEQEWFLHTDGVPSQDALKVFRAASGRR